MPLVSIQALPPDNPQAISRMILEVRDVGARALRCSPGNIWVVFEPIAPGHYIQGDGVPAHAQPKDSHPAIVIIRAQAGRSREDQKALARAVATAVGRGLSVPPSNVWIHYQEMQPQDVTFQEVL